MRGTWNQESEAVFSQTFLSVFYKADKFFVIFFLEMQACLAHNPGLLVCTKSVSGCLP